MSRLVCTPSPCGRYCAAGAGLLRRAVGLSRGCCAAAAPSCAAPSRGRGYPAWVRSRLQRGSFWARTMRPRGWSCLRAAPAPLLCLGAKSAPSGLFVAACRCALLPSGRKPSRACPPAAVLPAAAGSRCAVCNFVVCACIMQPLLQKHIKTAPKNTKKRQKARFLCGISPQASLVASTDSTLISPICGAYWAAVDAAQSPKRYIKPSTWWGAAPFRAGGKAQCPRIQGNAFCNRYKYRLQNICCRVNVRRVHNGASVRAALGVAAAPSDTARSARL